MNRPNQVWATDITYIRLHHVMAIPGGHHGLDWFSRYVISWQLSTSLEIDFCLLALDEALKSGCPEIFNTDQGSQFTSLSFNHMLIDKSIKISMDGRGRAHDNIFTERLWRSLKYEEVYLKDYQSVREAKQGIGNYLAFYNHDRLHQSLNYLTPVEVHFN
ncbi:IS3 family transposase [bacterium]|nr:IS3 family transposase [bacterium]